MRLHTNLYVIAAICGAVSVAVASPVQGFLDLFRHAPSPMPLEERQVFNCTDFEADFSEYCWAQLGLSDYLNNAETGWNTTVRMCSTTNDGTDSDGSHCCKPDQPWSTCYLHLAHGYAGADCSTITTECKYDPTLAVPPEVAPKVRYVMRNIYVINQFFTTYFTALQYAVGPAALAISAIVNELNPPEPKNAGIPWFNILTALSFGLAFLGAPTFAVGILTATWAQEVKYLAQAFIISMQQTPGLAKALYPQGTDDSKQVQIAQLSTNLGGTVNQLSSMINHAVNLLMSDLPTFVTFAQSGKYSGMISYSIPNETVGLDIALKTYLVSMAMGGNGWWAAFRGGPYTPEQLAKSSSCTFQENNLCVDTVDNAIYLSPDTRMAYWLAHTKGYTNKSPHQLLQDIVDNQWAPLNVLFDGAFNCTAKGKAGTTDVQFTFNGTLDVSCISQLPFYNGCPPTGDVPHWVENCPTPWINGSCPFPMSPPGVNCNP